VQTVAHFAAHLSRTGGDSFRLYQRNSHPKLTPATVLTSPSLKSKFNSGASDQRQVSRFKTVDHKNGGHDLSFALAKVRFNSVV
jgi:hypothetical protein